MSEYTKQITDQIKELSLDDMKFKSGDRTSKIDIIEEQKTYIWIRLFISEEDSNVKIGDDIVMKYLPSGEELLTKLIGYGKLNSFKDNVGEIVDYSEDDKKVLILMVDEKVINNSNEIPFIRTLFKTGRYYEFQLIRRAELVFVNTKNNIELDYYDCNY